MHAHHPNGRTLAISERVNWRDHIRAHAYFSMLGMVEEVGLDLPSLQRATGRELTADETAHFVEAQRLSYRRTFIEAGQTHPQFVRTFRGLGRS